MAEAEIIQFGSRDPRRRAGSAGSEGASQESAADGQPGLDSDDIPATPTLGGLLSELVRLASRSVASLKSPITQLGNPLHAAASLGADWDKSLERIGAFLRERLRGDYAVDEFGFDPEFTVKAYLPLLRLLADSWFRVEVRGAENLPTDGSALLVSNHAGTLPIDGMILQTVVYDEIGRHVRMLGADLIFKTPFSGDLARKTGTTLACQEDAERLLASNQLVAVFPEGFKGLGKPYADRYKLQRFGRGGFVSAALRAQVPIIPTAIVGSEEIYPLIARAPALARMLGWPYFPITPLFPWLGPLGVIPLPSKWIIEFGEAITTDELGSGAADDPMIVFNITDQVRETIQQTLYALLMQRRSAFF
jgi:1-acyl-sn-glycerol-3-phosphate acyltransferase